MFFQWGLCRDNFIQIDDPINVDELYVPTPSVVLRRYVHPVAKKYLRRALLTNQAVTSSYGERIYVSRLNIRERRLVNEEACVKIFKQYGFDIIYPEQHTAAEQIAIFKKAKLIAGVAGSAMHNLIFSDRDTRVLFLASSGWLVVADNLITSHFDHPLGYVIGNPLGYVGTHKRTQENWVIDMQDVEEAIRKHFFTQY